MDKRTIERNAKQIVRDAIQKGSWVKGEEPDMDSFFYTEGEVQCESIFLGTVLALTPNGKYYTPFANSNVADCQRCKGKGYTWGVQGILTMTHDCSYCGGLGSREAYEDELFNNAMEAEALKHDCWIENGEGDPLDIFLVRLVKE